MVEKIWNDPEIYSIRVELPQNPLRWLNSYVIKTPERSLVIDTGFNREECRRDLWSGIEELGLDLSRTALFLTHIHSDHTGLVGDFVQRGVPVYMGRIDYTYFSGMREGKTLPVMEDLYRQEGFPVEELALQGQGNQGRRYAAARSYPMTPVEDGQVLDIGGTAVQCIWVPGHTPGQMVLYLPKEQVLFSADHVLFDITPNIAVWQGVPQSLADYIKSLQKIRDLPVKAVFPAHRTGRQDLAGRVDELIAHHGQRLDEIYQCVRKDGGRTAFDIAGHITWSARGLGWAEFPPHQKWFAVGETLAHLYYLADRGQVVRVPQDGTYIYFSAAETERNKRN